MVTWHEELDPTGAYRFRLKRRLFGRAIKVKQIELNAIRYTGTSVDVDVEHVKVWRDERLTDIVYLNR